MEYDFSTLSHADFEDLVRDLLGRHLGIRFEAFTEGRDNGMDGRHASADGAIILQAKHYCRSTISNLTSNLRKERLSIDSLQAKRYLLATSKSLTPGNKNTLASIIGPSLLTQADVFGPGDLNALLREYPDIQESHPKLWNTSAIALKVVLTSLISDAHAPNSNNRKGIDLIVFNFWKLHINPSSLADYMYHRHQRNFDLVISQEFVDCCIYFVDQIEDFLSHNIPTDEMKWAIQQFIRVVKDFVELINDAEPDPFRTKYANLFQHYCDKGYILYLVDTTRQNTWELPIYRQISFEKDVLRKVMAYMIHTANGVIDAANRSGIYSQPMDYVGIGTEIIFLPQGPYPGLGSIRQQLLVLHTDG